MTYDSYYDILETDSKATRLIGEESTQNLCLVNNMEFERIFTRASNESVRYFGMNNHEDDYIFYCSLSIEGVPENISENEKEKMYDNPELAVKIGRIDG